jgi:hypothetical protein
MPMNYDEILKCYEGHTELHANTSFEFGLMNETYYTLFRDHDLLEYATSQTGTHWLYTAHLSVIISI